MKNPLSTVTRAFALAAGILAVSSCNEDQKAELKQLTEELETIRDDLRVRQEMSERTQSKLMEARDELAGLKSKLRATERELRDAERELAGYRRKEELAREAEERKPDSKEMRAAAKESVAGFGDRRVSIAGDQLQGSGLLVASGDKQWIYCARELVEANNKLEISTTGGTPLKKFGSFEVAPASSLVRLEVLEENLEAIPLEEGGVAIESGAPLLALNAAGKLIEGRCYGEGQDGNLRVDSRINACEAGSAIFHGESGQLIGLLVPVNSREPSLWPAPNDHLRETTTLARLGKIDGWAAVPIGGFLKEARMLSETDALTRLVHLFAAARADAAGVTHYPMPGGMSPEELLQQAKSNPAVVSLKELDAWLRANAARSSQADIQRKISGVYMQIDAMERRQTKELEGTRFSPAHVEAATRSLNWRREARKELDRRIEELQ